MAFGIKEEHGDCLNGGHLRQRGPMGGAYSRVKGPTDPCLLFKSPIGTKEKEQKSKGDEEKENGGCPNLSSSEI